MKNNHFSREITVFHGRSAPETGKVAGYAAIIDALKLSVPMPSTLALIGKKNRRYEKDGWKVFTPKLGNLYLFQTQMAELFEASPQNITIHLKNGFSEDELDEEVTCKDFLHVRNEGKRKQRNYNLNKQIFI